MALLKDYNEQQNDALHLHDKLPSNYVKYNGNYVLWPKYQFPLSSYNFKLHSPKTVFIVEQHCNGREGMLKVEEEQEQEDNLFEQQGGL